MSAVIESKPKPLIKLDIGCGSNKQPGHIGMDAIDFPGLDIVHDIRKTPWPIDDNSVEVSVANHVLEHLTNLNDKWERIKFFNELWRVTVPVVYDASSRPISGFARIVLPHWASNRYYGDPTHKEPFGEMGVCYLDPEWRKNNAPHTDVKWNPDGYNCHWACMWDHTIHPLLVGRNAEFMNMAMTFWKEAAQDLVITMCAIKKVP